MRLDFNQKGSWRKGPEFDGYGWVNVMKAGERLADLTDAKLRMINDAGEVCGYRDPGKGWVDKETRGAA